MKVILQLNGDFLEAFGKDAEAITTVLGTVLLAQGDGQTGIPVHSAEESTAALRAAGLEPHLVERKEGLEAIWRRTHRDFKGTVDGKVVVMVFRDSAVLVPLDDLSPYEIARLYPREELCSA